MVKISNSSWLNEFLWARDLEVTRKIAKGHRTEWKICDRPKRVLYHTKNPKRLPRQPRQFLTDLFPGQSQSVPKVIVMGSSTASETTINTSTDSSNTMVTTMTATDDTEDSLDADATVVDVFGVTPSDQAPALQPVPVTPKTPCTAKQVTPPTVREERKFVFDLPEGGLQVGRPETTVLIKNRDPSNFQVNGSKTDTTEDPESATRSEARRRNSYRAAQQDLDRIEVVGGEGERSPPRRRQQQGKRQDQKPRQKRSTRKQQGKGDKFVYDEKHVARCVCAPQTRAFLEHRLPLKRWLAAPMLNLHY